MAAIKKAIEFGADHIELDVRLSKDGHVVLLHDSKLQRTTGDSGHVWDYTLEELRTLDAGSWFAPEFAGERLPTLEEVIQAVKGKVKLDIEIKRSGYEPDIERKVIDIVRKHGFSKDCYFTSFDPATIEEIKRLAPDIKTGFIFGTFYGDTLFTGNWDFLVPKYTLVDESFMAKARQARKPVFTYTVNDEETMRQLIRLGVDGIITNYPERLKKVLSEKNR